MWKGFSFPAACSDSSASLLGGAEHLSYFPSMLRSCRRSPGLWCVRFALAHVLLMLTLLFTALSVCWEEVIRIVHIDQSRVKVSL